MWTGEDGSLDAITHGPFTLGAVTIPAVRFPAGKMVDIPEAMAGMLTGNPFFEIETAAPEPVKDDPSKDGDGKGKGGK